jgi:hypothetical protein
MTDISSSSTKQVGVSATVMYLPNPKKTPAGVWPIQLVKTLPPDEGGFHCDKHKQPYAKVIASKDDPTWTVDASHEILEMLVDPYGNRMQSPVAIEIVGKKSKMAPANRLSRGGLRPLRRQ